MASADFSQFVVTTADGTACETSTLKVLALSPHLPATSTGTSNNFWTSSICADLSVFPSLICGSCPSGQGFAYSFLQIPPHDGHPCCSAMYFVVAYAYSGLSPVRARPWRANTKKPVIIHRLLCLFCLMSACNAVDYLLGNFNVPVIWIFFDQFFKIRKRIVGILKIVI